MLRISVLCAWYVLTLLFITLIFSCLLRHLLILFFCIPDSVFQCSFCTCVPPIPILILTLHYGILSQSFLFHSSFFSSFSGFFVLFVVFNAVLPHKGRVTCSLYSGGSWENKGSQYLCAAVTMPDT